MLWISLSRVCSRRKRGFENSRGYVYGGGCTHGLMSDCMLPHSVISIH